MCVTTVCVLVHTYVIHRCAYNGTKVKSALLAIIVLAVVDGLPSLVVTSVPAKPYCPGPVLFTCNATGITIVFRWKLNSHIVGEYAFDPSDEYPLNLTATSPLIESIQVISVTLDGNSLEYIISTLRVSDVSVLNGSSIHCEDSNHRGSNPAIISLSTYLCIHRCTMRLLSFSPPSCACC